MKIESIIRRSPPTRLTFGSTIYQFKPDDEGRHVCEVADEQHLARLLSIPEGYRLVLDGERHAPGSQTLVVTTSDDPSHEDSDLVEENADPVKDDEDPEREALAQQFEEKFERRPHGKWTAEKIRAALEAPEAE